MRLLFLTTAACVLSCTALAFQVQWELAGTGNWGDDVNWADDLKPAASSGESAVISNGGTAQVTNTQPAVGGVSLGPTVDSSGNLEITSAGALTVQLNAGQVDTDGFVRIGGEGVGTLSVEGDLTALGIISNATSSARFAGSATVNVASDADFAGTTTIAGPNVDFQTDTLRLRATGTLVSEITAASHSPIVASGQALLAGALQVDFSSFTPSTGMSWDLVTAETLTGKFSGLEIIGGGDLAAGQQFRLQTISAGNQQTSRLVLDQTLILQVDTANGGLSIVNGGGSPIALDGYRITSAGGVLSTTQWNSLQDQMITGWQESNTSPNQLAELNPTDSSQVPGGGNTMLGNGFQPDFSTIPLGQNGRDLAFEYTDPTTGEVIDGQVVYVGNGRTNNLLLTIDPATGEARLSNDSATNLAIDGYRITSESNSLLTGSWTSLAGRSGSQFDGWEAANVSSAQLAELNPDSSLPLNQLASLNLGTLFNTAGQQDVELEFILAGSTSPMSGIVRFATLAQLVGDYNGDGQVNIADYTVWRDRLGSSVGLPNRDPGASGPVSVADYNAWKANFGAPSGSATAVAGPSTVPEPTTAALAVGLAIGGLLLVRRYS